MNAANSGMIIAGLSLLLGAAAIGPAWSADASHPYSNVNRSVDAGNDTGNGQTDQLNQRELQRVSPNGGRGGYDRQSNRGYHNDGYRDDRDNRYRYGGYERPPYGRPAGYGYGYGYPYYAPPAYGYGAPYPYYAPYPAFRPWWRPYGWYRPFYRPYHYRW